LNDSLIDLQIKLSIDQLPSEKRPKIHAFSSLFYTKVMICTLLLSGFSPCITLVLTLLQLTEADSPEKAHALVKRWTRHVDLFACEFVIVPVNLHYHWSIIIICRPGLLLSPVLDTDELRTLQQPINAPHCQPEVIEAAPDNATILDAVTAAMDSTSEMEEMKIDMLENTPPSSPVDPPSNVSGKLRKLVKSDRRSLLDDHGDNGGSSLNRPCLLCMDSIARLHPSVTITKHILKY
jgi:Ulp1 family protease